MSEYSNSLKDKNIIITGANNGIGYTASLDFAKRGANLILACRNEKLGNEAVERIKAESENENVQLELLDLGSLASTRAFAERILAKWDRLDILVNNAGIAGGDYKLTPDGFESHFQVNYLSHFLLTRMLLDLLKKSAPSRIISVSSDAHKVTKKMNWDDLQYEKTPYRKAGMEVYGQSKLAQILMSVELAERLEGTGVSVVSLHPGVVNTNISAKKEGETGTMQKMMVCMRPLVKVFGKSANDGAKTTIHCAVSPDIPSQSGLYFADSKVSKTSKYAGRKDEAARLWKVSSELVGLDPEIPVELTEDARF